ncbi:pherophorin, partial [Haematococcus lacustris]
MAHAQLLLVLLATLVAASRAAFPWCSCVDYSPSSSPYSLSLISTVATADNVTAVFRVNALPLFPSPSICYQTLLNNGIEKIEIASQLACLRNVRVLIDGLPSSASGVALPANYRTVANIKVKFSTLVRSSGTIITIIGSGACSSWPALFGGRPLGSFIYAVFNWGTGVRCCPLGAPPP